LQENQGSRSSSNKAEEQEDNSKGEFGIQGDFNTGIEELMIFSAVEYDAGASLHLSNAPTFQHIKAH
jgi:hypothetical protein